VKILIVILPPGADPTPHDSVNRMKSKSRTSFAPVAASLAKAASSGDSASLGDPPEPPWIDDAVDGLDHLVEQTPGDRRGSGRR